MHTEMDIKPKCVEIQNIKPNFEDLIHEIKPLRVKAVKEPSESDDELFSPLFLYDRKRFIQMSEYNDEDEDEDIRRKEKIVKKVRFRDENGGELAQETHLLRTEDGDKFLDNHLHSLQKHETNNYVEINNQKPTAVVVESPKDQIVVSKFTNWIKNVTGLFSGSKDDGYQDLEDDDNVEAESNFVDDNSSDDVQMNPEIIVLRSDKVIGNEMTQTLLDNLFGDVVIRNDEVSLNFYSNRIIRFT